MSITSSEASSQRRFHKAVVGHINGEMAPGCGLTPWIPDSRLRSRYHKFFPGTCPASVAHRERLSCLARQFAPRAIELEFCALSQPHIIYVQSTATPLWEWLAVSRVAILAYIHNVLFRLVALYCPAGSAASLRPNTGLLSQLLRSKVHPRLFRRTSTA